MTAARFRLLAPLGASLLLGACGHSDPFTTPKIDQQGPFNTVARSRITFNSDADYAPSWTADGRGIIYTYADPGRADHDRCLAILPAAGGTRIFTLCDNRPGHADSAETITSGALSTDGKLLYLVGSSLPIGQLPVNVTLFLADTSAPFNRRALLTLPTPVAGGPIPSWLGDVSWVAADQFVAMAQDITLMPQCFGCALRDTVFNNLGVVRGTVTGSGATLQLLAGTSGARSYSLADGGSTVVFAIGLAIFKVAVGGGTVTLVTTLPAGNGKRIDDVSCRGGACVVNSFEQEPNPLGGSRPAYKLSRFSSAGGAATLIDTTDTGPWSAVRLAPTGADAVVRVGSLKTGDLYLFRNLLP